MYGEAKRVRAYMFVHICLYVCSVPRRHLNEAKLNFYNSNLVCILLSAFGLFYTLTAGMLFQKETDFKKPVRFSQCSPYAITFVFNTLSPETSSVTILCYTLCFGGVAYQSKGDMNSHLSP